MPSFPFGIRHARLLALFGNAVAATHAASISCHIWHRRHRRSRRLVTCHIRHSRHSRSRRFHLLPYLATPSPPLSQPSIATCYNWHVTPATAMHFCLPSLAAPGPAAAAVHRHLPSLAAPLVVAILSFLATTTRSLFIALTVILLFSTNVPPFPAPACCCCTRFLLSLPPLVPVSQPPLHSFPLNRCKMYPAPLTCPLQALDRVQGLSFLQRMENNGGGSRAALANCSNLRCFSQYFLQASSCSTPSISVTSAPFISINVGLSFAASSLAASVAVLPPSFSLNHSLSL